MLHSDFFASAVKYEQQSGCSISVAHFLTRISWKACSSEIMEMWPWLTPCYRPASAKTPSAVRVPYYKNRGKIGESVQLPCNHTNSPFLLAASSIAPCSSSLNHGVGEASKGGDDGAGPRRDQTGSPHGEREAGRLWSCLSTEETALASANREMVAAEA